MSAIKIKGLHKAFGSTYAVENLDLEVGDKTVFGFLGPNGAGKTTTIRMMVGLIKPSAGTIEFFGSKIEFSSDKNHEIFGYLPEQPSFYGWMTGKEYLSFTAGLFGLGMNEREARINSLLEMVDLTGNQNKKISAYSNGMKQRLGIAQALINNPRVLILDEPVSALDPIGRREVLEIIEKLREEITVFMSTHVLADVDRVCNEVAIIDKGKLVVRSPLPELKERYASPILNVVFSDDPGETVLRVQEYDWVKRMEKNGNQLKIWLRDREIMDTNEPIRVLIGLGTGILNYGLTLPETEDLFVEILGR